MPMHLFIGAGGENRQIVIITKMAFSVTFKLAIAPSFARAFAVTRLTG